jgi:hypothetical protein
MQRERGVEVGELGGGEEEQLCGGWCHCGGLRGGGRAMKVRVCVSW